MNIGSGACVLRRQANPARTGRAEAARKIAEAGEGELVMGEFGNAADAELAWWRGVIVTPMITTRTVSAKTHQFILSTLQEPFSE